MVNAIDWCFLGDRHLIRQTGLVMNILDYNLYIAIHIMCSKDSIPVDYYQQCVEVSASRICRLLSIKVWVTTPDPVPVLDCE